MLIELFAKLDGPGFDSQRLHMKPEQREYLEKEIKIKQYYIDSNVADIDKYQKLIDIRSIANLRLAAEIDALKKLLS